MRWLQGNLDMTRYCSAEFTDWQLNVHRLLGQGFGIEDIAIHMNCYTDMVRDEVRELRRKGKLKSALSHWAAPAITYGDSK